MMKKLLFIFSFLGLVASSNAKTIMEIFPPPVKETPTLRKKFNKQYEDMSIATDKMALNINGVRNKELDFFNERFRGYVKNCQKYQPDMEKGLYNKRSLMSFFGCGRSLIATARDYKLLIDQRKGEIEVFRYEELLQKVDNMLGYGAYIHDSALRSLRTYYNENL